MRIFNGMLTLEQFEKYITLIKREEEYCHKKCALAREYDDIDMRYPPSNNLLTSMVELLSYAMELKDYKLLSWWIWEAECGKKEDFAKSVEDRNFPIKSDFYNPDLTTIEGLYKYIVACSNNKKYYDIKHK